MDTTIATSNEGDTLLTIDRAVAEDEATLLTKGIVTGNGSNLVFNEVRSRSKSQIY